MKFWQYVVGSGLAILIFSGAVFSEYSKYQKISFLENNPFTLTGEFNYPEKSYKDLIYDNGEYIRVFSESKINISPKNRELVSGKIFLSGAFFDQDNSKANYIRFGNFNLKYNASNIVISRDLKNNKTIILNYGRTSELYFADQEEPFIIPSKYEIVIDEKSISLPFKNENFHKQSIAFDLKTIDWDNKLSKDLKQGIEDIYVFRTSFKKFATKIPAIWTNDVMSSIKNISSFIAGKKKSNNEVKIVFSKINETKKLIDTGDKLSKNLAKSEILELRSILSNSNLKNKLDSISLWQLFKKSQKIWLSTVNDNVPEWIYTKLWLNNDPFLETIELAEFFDFNISTDSSNNKLIEIKDIVEKIKISNISEFEISSFRRRLFYLLKNKIYSGEIIKNEVLDSYFYIEKIELDIYKESEFKEKIIEEKISNMMDIIDRLIESEDDFSRNIVKKLIEFLQKNVDLENFKNKYLTNNENYLAIFNKIKLVGTSGLTPNEIEIINNIKKEEDELNEVIDDNDLSPKDTDKNIISNSKTLWGFLKSSGININITKFRTKRSSLKFETKFENTESGKKKISGIFDYNGQIFKKLSLGTASIRKLPPHTLSSWMKEISGKFEPVITEEIVQNQEEIIPQNSRKALVNKQFLKDLLVSLGFNVSKKNIQVISKDFLTLSASDVNFSDDGIAGNGISLKFDISTKEFYDILVIENKNEIYLSESSIDGKTLQEKSREFFKTKEKGD